MLLCALKSCVRDRRGPIACSYGSRNSTAIASIFPAGGQGRCQSRNAHELAVTSWAVATGVALMLLSTKTAVPYATYS